MKPNELKDSIAQQKQAQNSYQAGLVTVQAVERVERILSESPNRSWLGQTGAFMWHVYFDPQPGQSLPSYRNVMDAMKNSDAYGAGHYDVHQAPIGAVHWFSSAFGGQAAIEMGPLGCLTVSEGTDSRFGLDVGFMPFEAIALPYLGWSLDFGGSEPLVSETVVWQ